MKKDNIGKLENMICNVDVMNYSEAMELSKLILKEASGEFANFRKEFFSKQNMIQNIIFLGQNNSHNPVVLRNIILTLGHIARIYHLYFDLSYKFIFQYIKDDNKDIKLAVARFVTIFPQFEDYEHKWDYILSIPKISPQKISREYFISCIIRESDKSSPIKYVNQIISIIMGFMDKYALDEDTCVMYNNLIRTLQNNSRLS